MTAAAAHPAVDPSTVPSTEFLVVCLCAEWCGTCREYRDGFAALAQRFPGTVFRWLDIEDEAEAIGDLDIDNFPTILIKRGQSILFFGTMLPHPHHLQRTLETYQAQTPAESDAYAQADETRRCWQTDADLRNLGPLRA